jgi:N-acetylmuramoyl-L-alanine amidase
MKRCEFICVLGGIVAGFWPRRRSIIVAIAALVLLPIEVSDAGWLSDVFKSSSKHTKSTKHVTSAKPATLARRAASPKPHAVRLPPWGRAP